MKVALIAPLGWERYIDQSTGVQMALSLPELMLNPFYLAAFEKAAAKGDLVILDNGANERRRTSHKKLMEAAGYTKATEVVLPDRLGDGARTWNLTREFFVSGYCDRSYQYLYPVHGRTLSELETVVDMAAKEPRITTLGLPRVLIGPFKASIRIDLASWIHTNYPERFQLHLLGTSPMWPCEVKAASKYAPYIRSVDTSMPFNYALAGYRLHDKMTIAVSRPDNYWNNLPLTSMVLVQDNIRTFKAWASEE